MMPEIDSLWMDKDDGIDRIFQYKGIDESETFKGRLYFAPYDYYTKTTSEGGLWIGKARFKEDMVPVDSQKKHPCCNRPTLYPIVWCDDCGYEIWDKARNAKAA